MDGAFFLLADHLSRYYGERCAVDKLELYLHKGEVLGLLGANGAGKSTTLQMLAGILAPTTGRIEIQGIDLVDEPLLAKRQIGYLPEQPPVYRDLTVKEYLSYAAALHGVAKGHVQQAVQLALQRCNLEDVQKRLIGQLSKGFRQRVGIAQAIIHQPAIIILDEPTVGLDPIQIRAIRQLIKELSTEHSIILSTHILPEVQAVCDRVQIMNQGRSVFMSEVKSIDSLEKIFFELIYQDDPALVEATV